VADRRAPSSTGEDVNEYRAVRVSRNWLAPEAAKNTDRSSCGLEVNSGMVLARAATDTFKVTYDGMHLEGGGTGGWRREAQDRLHLRPQFQPLSTYTRRGADTGNFAATSQLPPRIQAT
jgi:hypothetical protein